MTAVVSKTVSVLTLTPDLGQERFMVFSNVEPYAAPEDDYVPGWKTIILHQEMWEDLGCPEDITVTVEPGDTLNR